MILKALAVFVVNFILYAMFGSFFCIRKDSKWSVAVTLGVGFFAGLKVTDPAMRTSMNDYLTDRAFFDYRLVSTLGFEGEDIEYIKNHINARAVEPSISFDVLADYNEMSHAIKAISIPKDINKIAKKIKINTIYFLRN